MKGVLVVVVIALSLIGSATSAENTCPARVSRAIAYQREAADIHRAWVGYIEAGDASAVERKIAGGAAWQREWVRRYVFVERVLRERCQPTP